MKVGIAQINTIVGDLEGNGNKIIHAYDELCKMGAEIVVFPELAVCGYPPRDLLFKSRFVVDVETKVREISQSIGDIPALIGYVRRNDSVESSRCWNAAAWCVNGAIEHIAKKTLLPTYDVFDEDRYFESADEPLIIAYKDHTIGVTICEDLWTGPLVETSKHYKKDPLGCLAKERLHLLLNLSASPWYFGKGEVREKHVLRNAADRAGCPIVYCNAVGGNDELVFDGHSVVVAPDGQIVGGLAGFREELKVIDTATSQKQFSPTYIQSEMEEVYEALVLGLRDYAHKTGFKKAVLGLSGGIDSALTAVIAAEALGAENVIGISLPSSISSQHSKDDAADLAENLGIRYQSLAISSVVNSAESVLEPLFKEYPIDVTEENIQARSRGLLLMAVSNKLGALLLTTGNKSELAVGYCTLYGDMCGGLAVISDLPKVKVFELCKWLNRNTEIIPWNTINKPPSAELRPDQKDEDSLPPYDILDAILARYVEQGLSRHEIIQAGFEEELVLDICRKVDLNEYKRKQAAPGLKVTPLAFGVGRRIPIVQKYIS